MSLEEEQDEIMFSSVLLNQRTKVEKECKKLQALIDIETSETLFIWSPDANSVNIVPDIFRKNKKIREDEDEDDDDDDDDDNHDGNVPKNSLPKKKRTFEIVGIEFEREGSVPDTSVSADVPRNSHIPKQIFMKKIGGNKTITPEIVVPDNNIVLEVEGSASPQTFVPYNYVNRKIKMHKHRKVVHDDIVSDDDIQRSQTSEHVPWGSQSPKTPWSQKKEHRVLVPQNSGDTLRVPLDKVLGIQLPGLYKPSGEGLLFLIIIYYILIFSHIQR
jgi:hypothetical protein